MSDITVVNQTQRIIVDAASETATVVLAGPIGPQGPIGEASYAYVDAGDALKVAKTGDTMTGTLTAPKVVIDSATPTLLINESDQAANARKWRIVSVSGEIFLQTTNDAESATMNAISITRAGAIKLNGTGVTSVAVPTPTASTHAARKDYVDAGLLTKLNLTGGTLTGGLVSNHTARGIHLRASGAPYADIQFDNSNAPANRAVNLLHRPADGKLQFYKATSPYNTLLILDPVGISVEVPAVTGANQAAQVTGYDAATGRLAIGGHEIGDTGWRDVTSLFTADWIGASSSARLRRTGDTVELIISAYPTVLATDPPARILILPTGFQAKIMGAGPVQDYVGYAEAGGLGPSIAIFRINNNYVDVLSGTRLVNSPTFVRAWITFTTIDAWPATLPGIAG